MMIVLYYHIAVPVIMIHTDLKQTQIFLLHLFIILQIVYALLYGLTVIHLCQTKVVHNHEVLCIVQYTLNRPY